MPDGEIPDGDAELGMGDGERDGDALAETLKLADADTLAEVIGLAENEKD